ncbi:WD40/YVTN/BNR-like repeat-containing protein [Amphibacillus sp. Q70]|uniref:WD40/YVTN/BNR-like repeat-containing protein n=1 Tax=Amphibacillus sp. Q70 TaxID=3453416 RepID=UPI003F85A1E2
MKKRVLSLTIFIMIVLMIATVIHYQSSREIARPMWEQQFDIQNNQEIEQEQPSSEQLQPIDLDESITYTLQNDELNITFNQGNDWIQVPVEKDQLFGGEYNGNKQQLIEGSYILEEDRVGFLYSEGVEWDDQSITFLYSTDQGESWERSVVTEPFPGLRFRKVDFLNDQFGYIIISGGRTMSQEGSFVFLTHDGGESWAETNNSEMTRLIADGGFVDEWTGFLSFGTINPEEPDVYLTEDGGNTWNKADFIIPEEYQPIFVSAEVPEKADDHLTVLVNQGPNGDYKGGRIKGRFISNDNGKTWEFQEEVEPDES